jgi:hypothetical protein
MIKKTLVFLILFILLSGINIFPSDALSIHLKAFETIIGKAEKNEYYKYGIYSSRIIAVLQPEIYLQADMLFAGEITTAPGYEKAYNEKLLSMWLKFPRITADMPPFNFSLVDFSKFKIVPEEEIYGNDVPILNFIDQRLSPIHTILKTRSITELEGASLIYVIKRIQGADLDNTYLILTENKKGFVCSNGKFYDCLGRETDKKNIENPVLVFNENAVWYPLMKRDDGEKNEKLKSGCYRNFLN